METFKNFEELEQFMGKKEDQDDLKLLGAKFISPEDKSEKLGIVIPTGTGEVIIFFPLKMGTIPIPMGGLLLLKLDKETWTEFYTFDSMDEALVKAKELEAGINPELEAKRKELEDLMGE